VPLSKLKPTPLHSHRFEAIGTQWSIDTLAPLELIQIDAIALLVEKFDQMYSRFREDSLVTQMSRVAGSYTFSDDIIPLWDEYARLYDATDGRMTPLIGDLMETKGYDANYSFVQRTSRDIASFESIIRDHTTLTVERPTLIDIGAIGKGLLIDKISQLLDDYTINDYVVDGSGDLRHRGTIENGVGLEDPFDPTRVIGVIEVNDCALAASAINRRSWGEGLHHILDPVTKQPVKGIVATWVIAESAMIADGLATALFFTEPSRLSNLYTYEYIRMHDDGRIEGSLLFEGVLF